ncbi:MAG: T9SS type A sorting domain-containing protein [Chitinophagaceae bacterium]|nr:T9SS type A sorting domain-containing protein [Chitinophagaceae bacterium]
MKKILTYTFFSLAGLATVISLSSSKTASQGVMGAAAANGTCGSCHGNTADPTTVINVSGIPAAGYTPGTTYPVTLTITNGAKSGAGFDLFFTSGAISNNPAGTMLMLAGKELHHIQRFPMASGVASVNFNWTAPAAGGLVTLTVIGNAVNSDNGTSGDAWNKTQFTFNAAPNSVENYNEVVAKVFPNPTSSVFTLETGLASPITHVQAIGLSGALVNLPVQNNQGSVQLNVANLAAGYYQLHYVQAGQSFHTAFMKK